MELSKTKADVLASFCKNVAQLTTGPKSDSDDLDVIAFGLLSHIIDQIGQDRTKITLSGDCDVYHKAIIFLRQNYSIFVDQVNSDVARKGDILMIAKIIVLVLYELRLCKIPLFLDACAMMDTWHQVELIHIIVALDNGENDAWTKTLNHTAPFEFGEMVHEKIPEMIQNVPPTVGMQTPICVTPMRRGSRFRAKASPIEEVLNSPVGKERVKVKELQRRIHNLENLLSEAHVSNDDLASQIDDLHGELAEKTQTVNAMKERLRVFTGQAVVLNEKDHKIKELESECEKLRSKIRVMESSEQLSRQEATSMADEISQLVIKNEELMQIDKCKDNMIDSLRNQVTNLQEERSKAMDDQKAVLQKLRDNEVMVQKITLEHAAAISAYQKQIADVTRELEDLRSGLNSQSLQQQFEQNTISKLEEQIDAILKEKQAIAKERDAVANEKQAISKQKDAISKDVTILQRKLEWVELEFNQVQRQRNSLHNELLNMQDNYKSLRDQLIHFRGVAETCSELEAENVALKEVNKKQCDRINELQLQCGRTQTQLRSTESRADEFESRFNRQKFGNRVLMTDNAGLSYVRNNAFHDEDPPALVSKPVGKYFSSSTASEISTPKRSQTQRRSTTIRSTSRENTCERDFTGFNATPIARRGSINDRNMVSKDYGEKLSTQTQMFAKSLRAPSSSPLKTRN